MTNENRQLSPEEYQVEVLKRRFADKVTNYEDEISRLLTQIAHLQQELQAAQQPAPSEEEEQDEA